MASVLSASHLCVERGGQRVLDDLSFNVNPGEIYALLGGNGAGKSTTLLTFLGFIPPSSGEVLVNGRPVQTDVSQIRREVAYLPESASLYGHLSARENLDYFLRLARADNNVSAVESTLDTVGLAEEARSRNLESYSKGMRQKVGIALAILRKVPILLLDEPTSGLDPVAIDEFNAIAALLAEQGTTILMVTHDVYGACQVARHIGLLRRGELVGRFEAPADGKISADAVHQAFAAHHK